MSYLLDKKEKRKKFFKITIGVIVFLVLFYFRAGIFSGLSSISQGFFRPVLVLGSGVGGRFKNLGAYFASKSSLTLQNESFQSQLKDEETRILNYNSVLAENESLKETLGRMNTKKDMVLSAILWKPNQSPYDTLIIDMGAVGGIKVGDMVFAFGNIPMGRTLEVYENSSKVVLFSNAGEKTQAIVTDKNIFFELVGRGGGNFEMILPRDITLQEGDLVTMPGINPHTLAIVETVISDPRDPFTKALLVSPVNVQELKFVEIEI